MTDDERIEEILAEWLDRQESGSAPDPEEVIRDHPELADGLRAQFAALDVISQVFVPAPELPDGTPKTIGEYRVVREIGRGGMGVVYEAEQASMGRRVALKVLSPAFTGVVQAVGRFQREARAAGRLHHTNIVPVHAMGEDQGYWFYAMELVEGETLSEVITRRKERLENGGSGVPRSESEELLGLTGGAEAYAQLARATAGVAEALQAAHEADVIHRDVKPTNLLIAPDGTLKLVDFGLARLSGDGMSMTITGQILGTPHYMSPEQAKAQSDPIDHRTDVYSLGATLYEALTLRTPFRAESFQQLCSQIISVEPVTPRKVDPRIPRDLETIVLKAMAKERDGRYRTAEELARDLRNFAEGAPILARRIGPVGRTWRKVKRHKVRSGLTAAVVLFAVLGAIFYARSARQAEERRQAEYVRLLAEAEVAMAPSVAKVAETEFKEAMHPGVTARDVLARAVELAPERPEAYWIRALTPGRTLEQRIADVDAAVDRGLARGTGHLLRAFLLGYCGKDEEAKRERELAARYEDTTPAGAYARGRLLSEEGRYEEAAEQLTRVIEDVSPGTTVRFLAVRQRAWLRRRAADWPAALDDLLALKSMGDKSLWTRIHTAYVWKKLNRDDEGDRLFEETLNEVGATGSIAEWMNLLRYCSGGQKKAWLSRASKVALRRYPEFPKILRARARAVWGAEGDPESALVLLDRAAALGPESHDDLELRGCVLADLKLSEAALGAYAKAIEASPGCARVHFMRAFVLAYQEKDFEETLRALDKARELGLGSAYEGGSHSLRAHALARLERYDEARAAARRAIELNPASPSAWSARAWVFKNLDKDYEKAADAWRRAAELAPREPTHLVNLGALLCDNLRQFEEALEALDKARKLTSDEDLCRRNRAITLHNLRRYDEALEEARILLEQNPEDAEIHGLHGQILLFRGQLKPALEAFDRSLKLDDSLWQPHLYRGMALEGLRQPTKALDCYETVLRMDPDNAKAIGQRGRLFANVLGRTRDALEDYERLVSLRPRSAHAWACRGLVLHQLGKHGEALGAFDKALEFDPDYVPALRQRGNLLGQVFRQYEKALADYDRALKLAPADARAWAGRGDVQAALRDLEGAVESLTRSVQLRPKDPWTWCRLGSVLYLLKKFEKAERAYAEVMRLDPTDLQAAVFRSTILCNHLGYYEKAIDLSNQVLAADPDNADASRNIATCLMRLGRYGEAQKRLEAHLERWPYEAKGWMNLGLLLLNGAREPKRAVAAFERALSLQPKLPGARLQRAFALCELGRAAEAIEETQAWIASGDGDFEDLLLVSTLLAEAQDPEVRDAERAVEYGQMAVQGARETPLAWFTLGAALCRAEQWEMAHRTLTHGFSLPYTREGSECYRLYFSLCLCKLGKREEARRRFEKIAAEIRMTQIRSARVERLRAEVEKLVSGSD